MLTEVFDQFIKKAPVAVAARGIIERVLDPAALDNLYERVSDKQYTRDLLFSSVFNLMNIVVCKIQPSIHAAYQEHKDEINSSVTAVYDKLNRMEIGTSQAMVRETAEQMSQAVKKMKGTCTPWLPSHRIKVIDGNCLEGSEHRITQLRNTNSGALPGKSLVIYEPALEMATDVFPCEDGHAQERALLHEVVPTVQPGDVIVMDRNFCVRGFLNGIASQSAFYITRQHKGLAWTPDGEERFVGRDKGNRIYEQWVTTLDEEDNPVRIRRLRIVLKKPIRGGEKEIILLTNLSRTSARAKIIAEIYRKRWRIETAFQELEGHLHSEINSLGYPKAALFGFCVALVTYNVLAVVKASLRRIYGEDRIHNELSGYYVAGHLSRIYEGMIIAIPNNEWKVFRTINLDQFSMLLLKLAEKVNMAKFKKHKRGPKKPKTKRNLYSNHPHVSTKKLLLGITP